MFAVPLMLLGVLVTMSNARFLEPYWLEVSAKATIPVLFIAPGYAALAAWDAARWRRLMHGAVRSWPELLIRHTLLVAGVTTVTFAVTLGLLYAQARPAVGGPRWDVLALGVWVTCGYSALGFALGRLLPAVIAAPSSFVLVWLWVAYTPAVQPFWLRNVTGNLGMSCCSLSTQLAPGALAAPALVAVALLLGVCLWLARPSLVTGVTGVLVVGLGVVSARGLVLGLGADPVVDRTGPQTCAVIKSDEFCAWPEDETLLGPALPDLHRTLEQLRAAGLPVSHRYREDEAGGGGFVFSLGSDDPREMASNLAVSPLYALDSPCPNDTGGYWGPHDIRLFDLAQAWLETRVGVSVREAAADVPIPPKRLRELVGKSPEEQLRWYDLAISDMKTCKRLS